MQLIRVIQNCRNFKRVVFVASSQHSSHGLGLIIALLRWGTSKLLRGFDFYVRSSDYHRDRVDGEETRRERLWWLLNPNGGLHLN
jgi:hypothetical protein